LFGWFLVLDLEKVPQDILEKLGKNRATILRGFFYFKNLHTGDTRYRVSTNNPKTRSIVSLQVTQKSPPDCSGGLVLIMNYSGKLEAVTHYQTAFGNVMQSDQQRMVRLG
jgi:hypothetical protein